MENQEKSSSLLSSRNLSFVVLFIAILISGYLSYLKYDTSTHAVCVPMEIFDCGTVLNSIYSEVMDIPIAWLGLGVNLLVLVLMFLSPRLKVFTPVIFGVLLFATLFSIYLIYVQAVIITKYCPYCLSHEALIFILFGFSIKQLMDWMNTEELETE